MHSSNPHAPVPAPADGAPVDHVRPSQPREDPRWAVFNLLPVGVVVHGPCAEALFVNRAARELLGLPCSAGAASAWDDAAARAVRDDGTPFPAADHPAPLALATQRPVHAVIMGFDRPEGDRVWLRAHAQPVLDDGGSVREVVCTLGDVTAEHSREARLRDSEVRYRQLVEKAYDVIYRLDDKGRFTYVNPAAARVTGHAPTELVGRTALALVRAEERRRVARALVRQVRARTPTAYAEFAIIAHGGRTVRVGQHMQLLLDGRRLYGFQALARELDAPARAAAPLAVMALHPERPAPVAPPRRGKVLVVDDNEVSRHVTVAMLENLGYHADTAADGIEAVHVAARDTYDVVLMDCQMPELDGFKATAFIREREQPARRVPIIAFTANVLPDERRKCLAAGMDDFLCKPVGLRQLEQVLERWIENARGDAGVSVLPDWHPLRGLEVLGDSAVVAEVLGTFIETTPAYIAELRHAYRRAEAVRIVSLAHSLKGAAAQVGAVELADLCARLQVSGRASDLPQAGELLTALEGTFTRLQQTLEPQRQRLERAARAAPASAGT